MHFWCWYSKNKLHFPQILDEAHQSGHGTTEGDARGQRQGTDSTGEAAYQRSWPKNCGGHGAGYDGGRNWYGNYFPN